MLPGRPARRAPGAAPWPGCAVRAQRGAWGILVSDSGVCGVLAASPAVWASWAAASCSQGGRARPPPVMKATLSGSAQPGEGARWGAGGLKLQLWPPPSQGSPWPLPPAPAHVAPLLPSGLRVWVGRTGRGSGKEALRKQISRGRKQGVGGQARRRLRKRGGVREAEWEREGSQPPKSLPGPWLQLAPALRSPVLGGAYSQKPLLQGPTERRESEDYRERVQQTH